jgi:hypothetical protein
MIWAIINDHTFEKGHGVEMTEVDGAIAVSFFLLPPPFSSPQTPDGGRPLTFWYIHTT